MLLAGTAIAGHIGGDVDSYTGCLSLSGGTLTLIKEGNAPLSDCGKNQVEAHFSGGDITSIAGQAGGGLVGGGTSGAVTMSLRRDCDAGQLVKWNGSAWVCGSDSNSTYAAGTGLDLSGSTFSIESGYQVKNTADCTSGQFATGFDGDGDIQCAAPAAPTVQTFQARQANFVAGDGVPDDSAYHTYVTLAVPAGTHLVTGKGVLEQGDDDVGFRPPDAFGCRIGNLPAEETAFFGKDNEPDEYGFALTGVVTTSGEPLTLQCTAANDLDLISVHHATLAAIKVG